MITRSIIVALLFICAGCLSSKFEYDHNDVVKYLKKNPTVADNIQKALHEGRLEAGMNMQEVELCWGSPNSIKVTEPPEPVKTVWTYAQSDNSWKSLPSSPYWERQIPMYTATFGADERLVSWHVYGNEKTKKGIEPGKTDSKKKTTTPKAVKKNKQTQDKYTDEKEWAEPEDIAHWPSLEFTSILVKGDSRSVIINGQILDEGAQILGIKILEIYPLGAKMQYGEEIQFLKKGFSTR